MGKKTSVYISEDLEKKISLRSDQGLSARFNEIVERFSKLIFLLNPTRQFTEREIFLIEESLMGCIHYPVNIIRGIHVGIRDDFLLDETPELNKEEKTLLSKLEKLTFEQEISLIETLKH